MSEPSKTPKTDEAKRLLERPYWDVSKVPFCRVLASLEQVEIESDASAERIAELEAQLDNAEAALGKAHIEANALALSIYRKEYADKAPDWHPLDDVGGLISQIDNMYAGVREQRDQARAENAKLRKALTPFSAWYEKWMDGYEDDVSVSSLASWLTIGDLRRASQALAGKDSP